MKPDIKLVKNVAKQLGMTKAERRLYGFFLHDCKSRGDYGSDVRGDYTREELIERGEEFLENSRKGHP